MNRFLASIWMDAAFCLFNSTVLVAIFRMPGAAGGNVLTDVAAGAYAMWTVWFIAALYHRAVSRPA